jgi:RNA polymerase sigma-70 factor, ECF subfamily
MELLQRFAAGDLEAFEALFRKHQREVYAWIVRIVRDSGAAEDLTVETFWRIHRAHGRFDPVTGNFRAWARCIATNAALDHLRHARRETELSDDYPAATRGDPAVRAELRTRIRRAFLELPAKYRLVATLALIEDEPYNEIAEAVGISAALVKVRVFRAVRMLRKKLNSLGVEATAK